MLKIEFAIPNGIYLIDSKSNPIDIEASVCLKITIMKALEVLICINRSFFY